MGAETVDPVLKCRENQGVFEMGSWCSGEDDRIGDLGARPLLLPLGWSDSDFRCRPPSPAARGPSEAFRRGSTGMAPVLCGVRILHREGTDTVVEQKQSGIIKYKGIVGRLTYQSSYHLLTYLAGLSTHSCCTGF
jgi:hypothetical protein